MDPIIHFIIAVGLSLLFTSAAMHKARGLSEFRRVLQGYRLMPPRLIALVSFGVPLVEFVVAIGLIVPGTREMNGVLAAILLASYGIAIWINLARGNLGLDCGCQFGASKQTISPALVIRNAGLALVALLVILPTAPRELQLYDYSIIVFGLISVSLIYAILNTQIANATRYQEINS